MSLPYEEIKAKSIRSVILLSFRNLLIQSVSIIGFFGLSVLLGPSEIGIFAIVTEVVSVLAYFSDIGLAPALIQQKEAPTSTQLRSVFTIQQILVITSIVIFLFFFPSIAHQKQFSGSQVLIVYSLLIAYFASSLKTIPAILLERKLEFGRLSQIDILENITFYLCALFFAWRGFGLLSYAYATFIRSVLGLSYLYVLSPWSIGINLDFKIVKNLLSYGLPFQINSFISLAKDRLSNIITAGILGTYSFGLISWGQKGPRIPLSFMDSVIRVSFPAYSRLQSDRPLFAKALSRNLFFISLLIIPALSILSLVAGPMVDIVPKYQKWHAALIPFYFFCFYFFIAAVTTPLTNAFNAIGQVKTTFKFMVMWTVLTWIFLPGFSYFWGINGALFAYLIIGLSSLIVWVYSQRQFNINVFNIVKFPFILSLISLLVALIAGSPISNPYWLLSTRVVVFSLVFLSLGYSRLKPELIWLKNSVFSSFQS